MFNMCSQILRNILKYLPNFRNVHVVLPFSRKFNHFSAFSFCENQPEFLWNTLLFVENLILNFNTYPQQLWVRKIGKRAHFKIQSPWTSIFAECLLKLIYNFYMCANDFKYFSMAYDDFKCKLFSFLYEITNLFWNPYWRAVILIFSSIFREHVTF
jgi:hypothetical protein